MKTYQHQLKTLQAAQSTIDRGHVRILPPQAPSESVAPCQSCASCAVKHSATRSSEGKAKAEGVMNLPAPAAGAITIACQTDPQASVCRAPAQSPHRAERAGSQQSIDPIEVRHHMRIISIVLCHKMRPGGVADLAELFCDRLKRNVMRLLCE